MSTATPKPFNVVYDAVAQQLQYEFPTGYTVLPSAIFPSGGITQLTGAVVAGPGSGSVAATIPLTSTHILVGNGSNLGTDVALSGDATLANTGAITLATVNGNVGSFTSANITVDAKGRITAAANGSGGAQVLPQVVFANKNTQDSVTGTAYGAVGPSASITLQKSTNKILVTCTGVGLSETVNTQIRTTIKRDGTTDLDPTGNGLCTIGDNAGNSAVLAPMTMRWVDAPGDTSSHTYQAYAKCNTGGDVVDYGANNNPTTITLEEILS